MAAQNHGKPRLGGHSTRRSYAALGASSPTGRASQATATTKHHVQGSEARASLTFTQARVRRREVVDSSLIWRLCLQRARCTVAARRATGIGNGTDNQCGCPKAARGPLRLPYGHHEGAAAPADPHGSGAPAANEHAQGEALLAKMVNPSESTTIAIVCMPGSSARSRWRLRRGGSSSLRQRPPAPRRIDLSLINRAKA